MAAQPRHFYSSDLRVLEHWTQVENILADQVVGLEEIEVIGLEGHLIVLVRSRVGEWEQQTVIP